VKEKKEETEFSDRAGRKACVVDLPYINLCHE
jgi:hypothetical protein